MPVATVVVVHFGDPEPTIELVRSLLALPADVEIVVVANDGRPCPTALKGRVSWSVPPRNLGYGGGFNFAVSGSTSPVLAVLNNDIQLSPDAFMTCLRVLLEDPSVGIVGPVLRYPDGRLQSGVGTLTRRRKAPRVLNDPGGTTQVAEWVTGAAILMRHEVAHQVGFDASYFLGSEDVDLCLRARAAGWRVLCCGAAEFIHHGSRTIGRTWYYYAARNRVWFARADVGTWCAILNWIDLAVRVPRVVVADVIKGRQFVPTRLFVLGLIHALHRKPTRFEGPLQAEPIAARVVASIRGHFDASREVG